MSQTRRLRTLQKLHAVKARKRVQSAQAATRSDDVSDVQVVHSKLDNKEDITYPDNITDSPVSSRVDDDEELSRKVGTDSPVSSSSDDDQEPSLGIFMPTHDDGEPAVVVDSREDHRGSRRNKHQDVSRGGPKDYQTENEETIDSTGINKASPLQRFDIVEGSFGHKGRGASRSGKGAHKKSSKISEKLRRSRKMRRDHAREDDTLSYDSQLEAWMNENKDNPLARALDRVFDYFDEMRSVGDESYSIRTEKTEETVPVAPRRSPGSFFADVEGIFTEGFSCGTLVAACESLNVPTFSFHEDETTVSGTKASKEALDSNASLGRHPKKFEGDSPSQRSSVLPEEDDTYTSTIATNEESKLPNETKSLEQKQSSPDRKSFDTQHGEVLRSMCSVTVADCLDETHKIKDLASPEKLQELVHEATYQAAYIRNNCNSDTICDIGQHSVDMYMSTLSALPAPEIGSKNISTAGESVPATMDKEDRAVQSGGSPLSHETETVNIESKSALLTGENEPTSKFSEVPSDKKVDSEGQKEENDDQMYVQKYVYAVGQSIKPSASFFSLDTRAADVPTKAETPKTAFQEAIDKLREMKAAPVADRIREIGDQGWVVDKFNEVFTCSTDSKPKDSSGLDVPTNGQPISISMENLENICACAECHVQGTETAREGNDDIVHEANFASLEDLKMQVVDLAKTWENLDQPHTGMNQPEWKVQDWHDSTPTERYSADASVGIVCDDEIAEPVSIPSSTFSMMGGISSPPAASSLGLFEDIPLDTEVKPRRKWEPISKVSTSSYARNSMGVKERTNGTFTKPGKSIVTSGHGLIGNDENAPNKQSVCEQSGTQNGGLLDTSNPFVSTKAKRKAWRNTQADDFIDIMSASARANDWNQIVSER